MGPTILMLLLAGAPAPAAPELVGAELVGDWRVTAIGGYSEASRRRPLTVTFRADGGVSGYDGCNTFGGTYEVRDGKIVMGDSVVTTLACLSPTDPFIHDRGRAFLRALAAPKFEVKGSVLKLRSADGQRLTLRRTRGDRTTR